MHQDWDPVGMPSFYVGAIEQSDSADSGVISVSGILLFFSGLDNAQPNTYTDLWSTKHIYSRDSDQIDGSKQKVKQRDLTKDLLQNVYSLYSGMPNV